MKICPVCKARCFGDMEVCFGCMHRFEPEEKEPRSEPVSARIPLVEEMDRSPRHAAEKGIFETNAHSEQAEEGHRFVFPFFEEGKPQAEYQLVISLRPL